MHPVMIAALRSTVPFVVSMPYTCPSNTGKNRVVPPEQFEAALDRR
jgi:hypothetical protein